MIWSCPTCHRFNWRKSGLLTGALLAPLAYLALIMKEEQIFSLFGFHHNVQLSIFMYVIFPIAGVPFVWFNVNGLVTKVWSSLLYVIFYYGLTVLFWLTIFVFAWASDRWH